MTSLSDWKAKQVHATERKAKRLEKGLVLGLSKGRPTSKDAPGRIRRPKRHLDTRKRAFDHLKAICRAFILLRAKRRAGRCEVGVICMGRGPIQVPYHIFPAASGNSIKYDPRNLLGACSACNGGEYFDRKRGSYARWEARHRAILGNDLFLELMALQGRKQISTAEANAMADRFETMIGGAT